MASTQLLSTLLILYLITFNSPPSAVAQCPYPCYPPPTAGGGGNTPPVITMPPPSTMLPPPSQTGNYPPPTGVYTPPTVFPYNPPNATYYGGAPPPPDPIVPWFPFYYQDPPRNPHKSSADELQSGSMVVIFLIHALVFQLMLR